MSAKEQEKPRTLFEKIWQAHEIITREDGQVLLYVDRQFIHEGSRRAFDILAERGLPVRCPQRTFGVADHYVPTANRNIDLVDPERRNMIESFDRNTRRNDITAFDMNDPRQGIVHVIGPEQGLTQPGMTIVCGDSHTSTHGALGALAFGIGASEVAHVLATQTLWQRKPKTMRIVVDGPLGAGVSAKDLALTVIGTIGAAGATGHTIEYAGDAIRRLSIEGRLTLCNMSIEAGCRAGLVAPDDTTFNYLAGRPYAPKEKAWDAALTRWRDLYSDADAHFDREVRIDARTIEPMVTWGTSPEDVIPINGRIPEPGMVADESKRNGLISALAYMGLTPGAMLTDVPIDRVFIGSCTNSRIEDLRSAAAVVRGRKVAAGVIAIVSPGSQIIKRAAESEGLDKVFQSAGFEWRSSGCSMCVGMNGDLVAAGERCISTSNRNFAGRQGPNARTHLASPAMAAAAAIAGRFTDVRKMLAARSS
jgi:3-isopropylmalate/(R)-2-methylmalate dehydratase large subunit